jgi:hypothetical protein
MDELHVSKLDAARRQLETAVRLYFSDGDPVSIHTLTAAAHTVLTDINKARGGTPLLKESIVTFAKKGKEKEMKKFLNAAANFFKHGEHDPEGTYTLVIGQSEMYLLDACLAYKTLAGEIVPVLGAYEGWFWIGPGHELVELPAGRAIERFRQVFGKHRTSKRDYLKKVLPMITLDPTGLA